ncbi:hypothetical protein F511_10221 [Dorcoceras hygrometricum]|uniref:Uncharacterized protein n=1 Tax=Dorcoceras hygrometricum TaxID=472368 RepID=A0A2Z7AUM7_9LAMI|nr:hypothetical protein F511_10221 [Dorcoceras hygrometricum]
MFGWLLLISRRACARALKRRRLNKWKRCVLSFTFKRSAAGSKACVAKVTSFGLVDASSFCVISRNQQIQQMVLATMIQQKRKVKDSAVGLARLLRSKEEVVISKDDVSLSIGRNCEQQP